MRALPAAAHIVALLVASTALAGPEARVRVRGSTRLDASATTARNGFVLQGSLLEDAGRPVSGALLRIRLIGADGSQHLLPQAAPCDPASAHDSGTPYRGGEELTAVTDATGRFCLRWARDLIQGRLQVSFDDPRGLLDSVDRSVEVERASPIELTFAPVPRSLSLDSAEVSLGVASRVRGEHPTDALPLSLVWTRMGSPTTSLVKTTLRPGETTQLHFEASQLGGPGPGELRAHLGQSDSGIHVTAAVVATASVTLRAPRAVTLNAGGDGVLVVEVQSNGGTVSSGSVEALVGDRTVGIAEVTGGRADLVLSLGDGPASVPVQLRYLPAAPWWLPGTPLEVRVEVPPASAWRAVAWALGLLAIAGWLAAGWRRPPHRERARGETGDGERIPQPGVTWVAAHGATRGWQGRVVDAHDGTAVPGATLVVSGSGRHETVIVAPDGSFHIEPPDSGTPYLVLRSEGPWHSAIEQPLPPQGQLTVTLITRRRALLNRLVNWARERGAPFVGPAEPTPGEIARAAQGVGAPEVARWAQAIEATSFGPIAVDGELEARVRALEPSTTPEAAKG